MPHRTTAVSVLPNDIAVTALRSDADSLADLKPEARRVQHGSAADHAVNWETAKFPRDVRHHIHWNNTTTAASQFARITVSRFIINIIFQRLLF